MHMDQDLTKVKYSNVVHFSGTGFLKDVSNMKCYFSLSNMFVARDMLVTLVITRVD